MSAYANEDGSGAETVEADYASDCFEEMQGRVSKPASGTLSSSDQKAKAALFKARGCHGVGGDLSLQLAIAASLKSCGGASGSSSSVASLPVFIDIYGLPQPPRVNPQPEMYKQQKLVRINPHLDDVGPTRDAPHPAPLPNSDGELETNKHAVRPDQEGRREWLLYSLKIVGDARKSNGDVLVPPAARAVLEHVEHRMPPSAQYLLAWLLLPKKHASWHIGGVKLQKQASTASAFYQRLTDVNTGFLFSLSHQPRVDLTQTG